MDNSIGLGITRVTTSAYEGYEPTYQVPLTVQVSLAVEGHLRTDSPC